MRSRRDQPLRLTIGETERDSTTARDAVEPPDPRGYRVIKLLQSSEVAEIRRYHDALGSVACSPSFVSGVDLPREHAFAVDRWLIGRLSEILARHVGGRAFFAIFNTKGPNDGLPMAMHQDWTYTNERFARATHVWIPLVDTSEMTGGLRVIDGSHRWTTGIRISDSGGGADPTAGLQEELIAHSSVLEVPAGSAVVFDPALVHGSGTNFAPHSRPSVAVALVPHGTDVVHFRRQADGEVTGFVIPEHRFLLDPFHGHYEGLCQVSPWAAPVRSDHVAHHLHQLAHRGRHDSA